MPLLQPGACVAAPRSASALWSSEGANRHRRSACRLRAAVARPLLALALEQILAQLGGEPCLARRLVGPGARRVARLLGRPALRDGRRLVRSVSHRKVLAAPPLHVACQGPRAAVAQG
jgi:hypothetical protein